VARAAQLWADAGQQWRIAGLDSASAAAFDKAGHLGQLYSQCFLVQRE